MTTESIIREQPLPSRGFWWRLFNPPRHILYIREAETLEDCIQHLEAAAGLPEHDLRFCGREEDITTYPLQLQGTKHHLSSETNTLWANDPKTLGSITGSVIEVDDIFAFSRFRTQNEDDAFPLSSLRASSPKRFIGKLIVVKNCRGVFKNGICEGCGHPSLD